MSFLNQLSFLIKKFISYILGSKHLILKCFQSFYDILSANFEHLCFFCIVFYPYFLQYTDFVKFLHHNYTNDSKNTYLTYLEYPKLRSLNIHSKLSDDLAYS
jgi:hypothetical protein